MTVHFIATIERHDWSTQTPLLSVVLPVNAEFPLADTHTSYIRDALRAHRGASRREHSVSLRDDSLTSASII